MQLRGSAPVPPVGGPVVSSADGDPPWQPPASGEGEVVCGIIPAKVLPARGRRILLETNAVYFTMCNVSSRCVLVVAWLPPRQSPVTSWFRLVWLLGRLALVGFGSSRGLLGPRRGCPQSRLVDFGWFRLHWSAICDTGNKINDTGNKINENLEICILILNFRPAKGGP